MNVFFVLLFHSALSLRLRRSDPSTGAPAAAAPAADAAAVPTDSGSDAVPSPPANVSAASVPSATVTTPTVDVDALIPIDGRFAKCKTNVLDPDCLQAQAQLVLLMSADQSEMSNSLASYTAQLKAMNTSEATAQTLADNLMQQVYGSGLTDSSALMGKIKVVRGSVASSANLINNQTAQVSSAVSQVVNDLTKQLASVKAVMQTQLEGVKNTTNTLLDQQQGDQSATIGLLANGMKSQAANVQDQAAANQAKLKQSTEAVASAALAVQVVTQAQSKAMKQTLDDADDSINQMQASANNDLKTMTSVLKDQISSATSAAAAKGISVIQKASTDARNQISSTFDSLQSSLQSSAQDLTSLTSAVNETIVGNITQSKNNMLEAKKNVTSAVSDFKSTVNKLTSKLQNVQKQAATEFDTISNQSSLAISQVNSVVGNFVQSSAAKITDTKNSLSKSIQSLKTSASNSLSSLDSAVTGQLMQVNKELKNVQDQSNSQLAQATAKANSMLASAQQSSAADAAKQAAALSDASAALAASSDAAKASISAQESLLRSRFTDLGETIQSAMSASASTASDLSTKTQQQLLLAKQKIQNEMSQNSAALNGKVSDLQAQQAAAISGLNRQVQGNQLKAQDMLAQLQATFGSLISSSQDVQGSAADLSNKLSAMTSAAVSKGEDLQNLLRSSSDATSTAAQAAQQQIQQMIAASAGNLNEALRNYASEYQDTLNSKLSSVNDTNGALLTALEAMQNQQKSSVDDATKKLADIKSALSSLPVEEQFKSMQAALQAMAQAQQAEANEGIADAQAQGLSMLDALKAQMTDLLGKTVDDAQQKLQSTGTQISSKVADLLSNLGAQQQSLAQVMATSSNTQADFDAWFNQFGNSIETARESIRSTVGSQMQQLLDEDAAVKQWSNDVIANATEIKSDLSDLLEEIPSMTDEKVNATQSALDENQAVMTKYIQQLQTAFDQQRAAESSFLQRQSLIRLGAILGIDKATLEAKTGLLQKIDGQGLNSNDLAQQSAAVLSALADAVQKSNDPSALNRIKSEISNLQSSSGLVSNSLSSALGSKFSDLYAVAQQAQQNWTLAMAADAQKTGSYADAVAKQLGSIVQDLHDQQVKAQSALSSDAKNIFEAGSEVSEISTAMQLRLQTLLHDAKKVVQQAAEINGSSDKENSQNLNNLNSMLADMSATMGQFIDSTRTGFQTLLDKTEDFRDSTLTPKLEAAQKHLLDLTSEAHRVASLELEAEDAVKDRMKRFLAIAQKRFRDISDEKSAIKLRSQSQLDYLQSRYKAVLSKADERHSKIESQIESWLTEEAKKMDPEYSGISTENKPLLNDLTKSSKSLTENGDNQDEEWFQ
jgi:hypothetical protein